jgi:hypothetical protein
LRASITNPEKLLALELAAFAIPVVSERTFFLLPLGDLFLAPSHSVGGPATSLCKKRPLGFATLPRDSFAFVTERFLEKQDALVLLIACQENTKLSRNSKKLHDNINRSSREGRMSQGV